MKVINVEAHKFIVGLNIIVIRPYCIGSITLQVGSIGRIEKITTEHLPDLGLFNLRILHIVFGSKRFGINDKIAEDYFDVS
jgi:hypothetical protein